MSIDEIKELEQDINNMKADMLGYSDDEKAALMPTLMDMEATLKEAKAAALPSKTDDKPKMSETEKAAFAKRMKKAREAKAAEDIQKRWDARKEKLVPKFKKGDKVALKDEKHSYGMDFSQVFEIIASDFVPKHGEHLYELKGMDGVVHDEVLVKESDLHLAPATKKQDKPTPSVKQPKPKFEFGDSVMSKDKEFNGIAMVMDVPPAYDADDKEYIYSLQDEDSLIFQAYESSLKSVTYDNKKGTAKVSNDKFVTMGKIDAEDIDELERVHFGCDLYAKKNKTDLVWYIETVVGTITCKPGETVLYLKNGNPYTVMQEGTFAKRCIKVAKDEKLTIQTETSEGEKSVARVNESTGEVVKAPKKKKQRVSLKIEAGVEKLAIKMTSDGCDVATFLKEVKGTPIDDAVWGKIAEFNNKITTWKIERVVIDEKGNFIAQVCNYGGVFGDLIKDTEYYRICATEGTWELIDKRQWNAIAKAIAKRQFKVQYSTAEMKRYYNYGDPSVKKYDAKMMACKALSKEAYELQKGSEERHEKFVKHYETCRNQVLNEYNRVYLQRLHEMAAKHKAENAGITYKVALQEVRAKLLEKAQKAAA